MQTPQGVVCRALIMLSAVLALPYLAVFGLELPQGLIDLVPKDWIPPALQSGSPPRAQTATPPIQYRIDSPSDQDLFVRQPTGATATSPGGMRPNAIPRATGNSAGGTSPLDSTHEIKQVLNQVSLPPAEYSPPGRAGQAERADWGQSPPAEAMQARFEELGALDTELAPWGSDLYRFQGRFAIGRHAGLSRYFSATDPNPQRAMEKVLAQVEAWRNERR